MPTGRPLQNEISSKTGRLPANGVAASSAEAVALVAEITFVTGIFFLLLALFRMGWISQ
jgi:MFS superfamily sulfate permease-like transporter